MKAKLIGLIFMVALVLIASLAITGILPLWGTPTLSQGEPVKAAHIESIVSGLDVEKIHGLNASGKSPEIEILVTPENQYFNIRIENGAAGVSAGRADDPDIRLTGSREVVARLLSASDRVAEMRKIKNEGLVKMDMLRSMDVLVAMGYKDLYDELG